MSGIHFNIEAVDAFCRDLGARSEAIAERLSDERVLYETVFDVWRDERAHAVRARLEELTRTAESCAADLDDLIRTLREQIRTAEDYLRGPGIY